MHVNSGASSWKSLRGIMSGLLSVAGDRFRSYRVSRTSIAQTRVFDPTMNLRPQGLPVAARRLTIVALVGFTKTRTLKSQRASPGFDRNP